MIEPLMQKSHVKLIQKYLKPDHVMLEWGSGGSTVYFPKFVREYFSIEHNREWFDAVSKELSKKGITNVHLYLSEVEWYKTARVKNPTKFKDYINFVGTLNRKFDCVLIDGRARLWCAEKVLPYLSKSAVVFLHDFWARPRYRGIFKWYSEIESVRDGKSIIALKRK